MTISGSGKPGTFYSYADTPWYKECGLKDEIEKVVYGSGVTETGNYVFKDCTNLKEVSLSNTVTMVGLSAFMNTGLTSFTPPATLTTILKDGFRDCTSLKTVELKNGFKDLSFKAFAGDTALDYIVIPERIIGLETNAFDDMKSGFTVYSYADVSGIGSYCKENGYNFYLLGDVNLDGSITKADSALLLKYLSGKRSLTQKQLIAAKRTDHSKAKPNTADAIAITKAAK